VHTLLQWIR